MPTGPTSKLVDSIKRQKQLTDAVKQAAEKLRREKDKAKGVTPGSPPEIETKQTTAKP